MAAVASVANQHLHFTAQIQGSPGESEGLPLKREQGGRLLALLKFNVGDFRQLFGFLGRLFDIKIGKNPGRHGCGR